MKKRYFIFVLSLIVLVFVCVKLSQNQQNKSYVPSGTDIVNHHSSLDNAERLKEFMNRVKNGEKDTIRVVKYTIEGDAIVDDVSFDGKILKVKNDATRDEYGKKEIETYLCKSIEMSKDKNNQDEYVLTGCFEDGSPYRLATNYEKEKKYK